MIGKWWATGISLTWDDQGWGGKVEFYDDCWVGDDVPGGQLGTQGVLQTRYHQREKAWPSLDTVRWIVFTLKADAERLGIEWFEPPYGEGRRRPFLYGPEENVTAPLGWAGVLGDVAREIGWESYEEPDPVVETQAAIDAGVLEL